MNEPRFLRWPLTTRFLCPGEGWIWGSPDPRSPGPQPSPAPAAGPCPRADLAPGAADPHPLPRSLPHPLPVAGRPCRALPPPRTHRPRSVSPGAAGAAERARGRGRRSGLGAGRGRCVGGRWCFPSSGSFLLPAQPRCCAGGRAEPLLCSRAGSGRAGGPGVHLLPPARGAAPPALGCSPTHVHGRKWEAPGWRRCDAWGLLAWDGMGRVAVGTRTGG